MRELPGGTAYYTAIAFASLGLDTQVITKVKADDDEALLGELRQAGCEVVNHPSEQSTIFENIYPLSGDLDFRLQRVQAVADAFFPEDLARARARAYHLGPLTDRDLATDLLEEVAGRGALVSLDVQGLLRRIEVEQVRHGDWLDKGAGLAHIDILKADEEEARILSGEDVPERAARMLASYGPREVVVTFGSRGSLVCCDRGIFEIPAFPRHGAVDTTGCGDTYIAGYLFWRLRSEDVEQAGRFAAAVAALSTERFGPFRGTQEEVLELVGSREGE